MAWFSVLKGAYPSLPQIDKTLPVRTGQTGIVRGSCIYQTPGGLTWQLAAAADKTDPEKYIYFALMGQNDFQAGMAGSIGQGPGGGVARVTGLACGMPFEFQSDQFRPGQVYAVGKMLTVYDGGLMQLWTSGDNVVGQVTKIVTSRWVNDAIAVTGRRTGANVSVLTARSLWLPTLA